MILRVLLLSLCLGITSLVSAAGAKLEADLRTLELARNLPAMQERLARADASELESVQGFRWRSWMAQAEGDVERAKAVVEQGLRRYPDSASLVLHQTSLMVLGFGDTGAMGAMRLARRVRQGFERAVELDPEHVGARIGLIQYYLNAPRVAGGGAARAEPHLQILKQISPASYLDMQVQKAALGGDLNQALDLLDQALAEESGPERQLSRGLLLQAAEQHEQARETFIAMVEQRPSHGAAWYQLGRTSVLAEQWIDEGQQAFQRFLELPVWPGDPAHAAAWWRLGQLHAMANDSGPARAAFEQALALDPGFEEARQSLGQLVD